ncbi:trypsin-like peptidase domain-containing protein [Anaeromyxobacter terrae]|uniref:trypsin-like peptidase domain-containing protein n=1 Tax=Anaeromyxobacter terrae TaxID=2925406 RepID=UPI001F5AFB83|nr:S1C family serine protease [Anaeromyxobacter sp. SG22]
MVAPGACQRRAFAGDREAAKFLWLMPARGYDDPLTKLRWQMHAARLGDELSLDSVLREFMPEGAFRNDGKLKEFIELGVQYNRPTGCAAKAAYIQDLDPATAAQLYERAAMQDHCLAQAMLAASFLDGVFTEINEAKAYFWWLVSLRPPRPKTAPRLPYIVARLREQGFSFYDAGYGDFFCPTANPRLAALQTGVFAQEVQDALLDWRPGKSPPEPIDRFKDVRGVAMGDAHPAMKVEDASATAPVPALSKLTLSAVMKLSREAPREDLYDRLNKSVYVVYAAPSKRAIRTRESIGQGSAVAVARDTVLTNCHIVRNRPEVFVLVGGQPRKARVTGARVDADACVLRIEDSTLAPVAGVRSASEVRVGEEVLAIGSPSGFTNTLSAGIVSQHRARGGTSYIQTTAQISPGSSGGGLFDKFGNLIGITTFKIGDAEGLNFAVAVDEFVVIK